MKNPCSVLYALLLVCILAFSGCQGNDCADASFCIGVLIPERIFDGSYDSRRQAVVSAVEDINAAGGDIELVFGRDTDRSFDSDALRDVLNSGVDGIIGPTTSADSVNLVDDFARAKMVAISPSASSVEISTFADDGYFFRAIPSDAFQAPILAKLIKQAGGKRAAILFRDDSYGRNLKDGLVESLKQAGVSSLEPIEYGEGPEAAVNAVVSAVNAEVNPVDSVVLALFREGGANLMASMLKRKELKGKVKYYGADSLSIESFAEIVVALDPEALSLEDMEGFVTTIAGPDPCRLEDRKEIFDEAGRYARQIYDAVALMKLASIKSASSDPAVYVREIIGVSRGGTKCRTYAECAGFLTDGDSNNDDIDYHGFSGELDFDANGDVTKGFYYVHTYDDMGGRPDPALVDLEGNPAGECKADN
ncbi:MAG: ABC transporter substrate-binding protein [Candidatus Dadabacteria bacterium]|nr:ABC transporter substrate-binding protein [Candidatus Dadabacteria bacterium]MYC39691.1 ABC transporter substrate-binding protein [Candidatus Dadabacteria bacterium]